MSRSWCILFDGRILGGGEYLMQNLSFLYKVSLHKVSFERQAENQTFGRKCDPGLKAKAYSVTCRNVHILLILTPFTFVK
jgi:hypothetical protein